MQKQELSKFNPIALAVASALGAYPHQQLLAATCTANDDATLRSCITNSANGDVIDIQADVTLSSFLPDITKDLTIQGNNHRVSGNDANRVLWVESGTVAISNLTIANGLAQGGSGGGGGAGLGAGLFVNGGNVSLTNLNFDHNVAKGGIGGNGDGHGGGGMGGNGGSASGNLGGGGGGRLPEENAQANGFGSGGGGGDYADTGSNGGFGGGGGNGGTGGAGGKGGFGGGGGGGGSGTGGSFCYSYNSYGQCTQWYFYDLFPGYGGTGGFGGGIGSHGSMGVGGTGTGGSGLGAGAAIFAKAGTLSLKNVAFTQNSNSGGTGGNVGQGKATFFICTSAEDATCTATVTTNSCGVTFSSNTAANAGTTDTDNADTFKVSRTTLQAACALAPIVSTNAPTVVTANSAKLSGTVNPNGSVTTASFDFGPTVSYGTNIVAAPASIAATAMATNVSADKAGLGCNSTYHYRVKAINSNGTVFGTDKSFVTNTVNYTVTPTTTVGGSVTPNMTQTAACNTTKSFTVTPATGYVRSNAVGGTCPSGTWNGKMWTTGAITANCTVSFTFTVYVSPGLCGDADGNKVVNIVDALAIARKVVGLPPPPPLNVLLADVNRDGRVAITDSLHIERYTVGLLIPPEVCGIGLPL